MSCEAKTDPFLPVTILQTGQSAKSRFCELEGYKAAIGELTLSAKSRLLLSKESTSKSVRFVGFS